MILLYNNIRRDINVNNIISYFNEFNSGLGNLINIMLLMPALVTKERKEQARLVCLCKCAHDSSNHCDNYNIY